jgi:2-keto-3-deoxy-L-rhamnonate aldolase RhmA
MLANPVRARLLAGGTAFGTMAFEFFTPGLAHTLASAGAEFVLLDMEHSGAGIDTMKAQIRFARAAGIMPGVRVPACERHLVTTILDAGALGIMVPFMETAEQAASLASWCRYRPKGTRGLAFGMAHDDYGVGPVRPKMDAANEAILTIGLIESARGVANADAILRVDGFDLGWIGHFDLSDSLGMVEAFEDLRYQEAERALLRAAEAAGKPMGWLAPDGRAALASMARGYRCIGIGTDVGLLRGAFAAELETAKNKGEG